MKPSFAEKVFASIVCATSLFMYETKKLAIFIPQ